jgi:phosphate transport system substrate-binding protein
MTASGRKFLLYVVILFSCAAVLLPVLNTDAGDVHNEMRGKAFTSPSKKLTMPDAWVKKPIKHEEWAKGADIAVSLEQDVYQTILPIIQKYAKEKGLKIAVKEGTCGIAAGMLLNKTVDIGGFCCPAGNEDRLPGIKFHTLGIVGKAYLIHPSNTIDSVSVAQLRDIFRGKVYRWSELKTPKGQPGPDWTIRTIARLHCPTRPGHWHLLLDKDKSFSPETKEVGSIPDMLALVAASRESIGSEVLSMVEKYKYNSKVKILKLDGHSPNNPADVASMKYPFYRTYNITTWEGKEVENLKAQGLVDYLIKETANLDPARFGFVPSSRLKKAGWKYIGNELVGEPG